MTEAAHPKDVVDEKLGTLPAWNLADLYPGPDSAELENDLSALEAKAVSYKKTYAGTLPKLAGDKFCRAIEEYEQLQEIMGKVMSYAYLVYAGDMSDPGIGKFFQSMQERITAISTHTLFFSLELNKLDDAVLQEKIESGCLREYEPWIRDLRAQKDYQLSDDLEELLLEKRVSGRSAWVRLFDETMAALRFPFGSGDLGSAEILNKLSHRDPAVRQEAAQSLGKVLGQNKRLFAHITNTLAKDKETEDLWRGFARPVSSRNLANVVEDDVVEALVSSVTSSYGNLSHRYYKLKAKWFGVEQLPYWDRNAPLPDDDDTVIPWEQARDTVLTAYAGFSPELAAVGKQFFDNPWIDAPVRPGKAPGAFAHPVVPSAHPYLLVNYQGRTRDVMTLAHELGHGVHQVLAGSQGLLKADTPLTLAETASVFGEMLTFQSLLKQQDDPNKRRIMLASKVEDMLNTVVRQISMHQFETRVHDERRKGELLPEQLGEIWMDCQKEGLGSAIRFEEEYANYWSYIPHFVHSPFYVYAYAFGDCLVNSLYAVYQQSEAGFAEKYLEMLSAGGSKRHQELLAPFGLDASDPNFWKQGLKVVSGFIDQLEAMES
ncbi:M3 family oligoendopeptidase [Kiloniella laminariae]|uniref:M3 family oligoendopeptidase n=1 Tax=Kiloniella laminariae TaxID=454162 RepID=UPI00037AF1BF|nr:M3 family oligoendopeptidase [Kiloniella laminariae]